MRLPTARAVAGGTGSGPHEGQAVGRAASLQGFGSVAVLRASLQGCSQCPEDRRVERKSQVRVRRVCADLEPPTPPPSSLGLLEKPIPQALWLIHSCSSFRAQSSILPRTHPWPRSGSCAPCSCRDTVCSFTAALSQMVSVQTAPPRQAPARGGHWARWALPRVKCPAPAHGHLQGSRLGPQTSWLQSQKSQLLGEAPWALC